MPDQTAGTVAAHRPADRGGDGAWDAGTLLQTLRGDRAAAARVVVAFLEDCPRVAQCLRDALRGGDAREVERLAHRLRGNAAILRAPAVRDAAARLERGAAGGDLSAAEEHLLALEQGLGRLCDALGGFLAETGEAAAP